MKILWMTWRDRKHPLAGGAEVVNEELARRLTRDGHEVVFLVGAFPGSVPEEIIDGYRVVRRGNRFTVYWQVFRYYYRHLRGWADLVIDEVNTVPFFAKYYVKENNILLVHQLAREIWFYQMFFPLNLIGYLLEPIYLRLLSDRPVVTISQSTKQDLLRYGFRPDRVSVVGIGIELYPLENLDIAEKYPLPTLLSHGSLRAMKRPDQIVKAFELAKEKIPNLELVVSGLAPDSYGQKVLAMIRNSRYRTSIRYLGRVNEQQKIEAMRRCHLLCVASVKEGWCIVVTEANSQGTPAIVYNVDGLRDSVRPGVTGVVCGCNTPADMAEKIVALLGNPEQYRALQVAAWEWSKQINFDNAYQDFWEVISHA